MKPEPSHTHWIYTNLAEHLTNFQLHYNFATKRFDRKRSTGLCNSDTKAGIFRKKSNRSQSRLSINQSQYKSSSCPPSPRQGTLRLNNSTSSLSQLDTNTASTSSTLHRSASTMSAIRPRSSPSGLFSYTGNLNY